MSAQPKTVAHRMLETGVVHMCDHGLEVITLPAAVRIAREYAAERTEPLVALLQQARPMLARGSYSEERDLAAAIREAVYAEQEARQ